MSPPARVTYQRLYDQHTLAHNLRSKTHMILIGELMNSLRFKCDGADAAMFLRHPFAFA